MSPEMLTLVAAVLAYDLARDMVEARSSIVETTEAEEVFGWERRSRIVISWRRLEKDILGDGELEWNCADSMETWRPRLSATQSGL